MKLWKDKGIAFWWLPPKGIRSFEIMWAVPYDGIMHYCICVWLFHVEFFRDMTKEDYD